MEVVSWIRSTWVLLLSYAALFNCMSGHKPMLSSGKFKPSPNSSTVLGKLNGAQDVGMIYSRAAVSPSRDNTTLRLHNGLRRDVNPLAANMPELRWSFDLARLAELWSRHCIMGYGLPLTLDHLAYSGQILQNIWSGRKNGTIEDALSSWLKEGNDYNFETRACYRSNGCRNYLTLISAAVYEVGCGLSHCNDDVIAVCYYGARDHKFQQSPYAAGKPCSQCGTSEWCDGGLCRSSGIGRKGDSVGTNCVHDKIDLESNDGTLHSVSPADGSMGRQRRHTTEEAQKTCGTLNITAWIFVSILVGVVGTGLLIGIIYMLAHILCRNWCNVCCNSCTCDGCSLRFCASCEGSRCCTGRVNSEMSETRSGSCCCLSVCRLKCCKKVIVKPDEETPSTPGGSSSPAVDSDPSLVHVETQTAYIEHVIGGTNTDPGLTSKDASTSTEPDPGPSLVQVETQTAHIEHVSGGTNTDPEPTTTTTDRSTCTNRPETSDVGICAKVNCENVAVQTIEQVQTMADPSHGRCLDRTCTTCDLHKGDQRQTHMLRRNSIRKLIKASKNENLPPGTYII